MATVDDEVRAGSPAVPLLMTVGLLAGPFLSMLDANIVTVAVPQIARSLHAGLDQVQWTVSGYLLALGAALAGSAYLQKRLGAKTAYLGSLVGFTLASALCAASRNADLLIGARVLQGLAGAALVPIAMSMLLGSGAEETRRQLPALAGVLLFAAPSLGPTVGGALVAAFGWQVIFAINVPLGLLGIAGALRIRGPVASPPDPNARFDPLGMLLLASGLALALYGVGEGPARGWLDARSWPCWSAGALLLALYVVWALRHRHPAVDLGLLGRPQSLVAVSISTVASVVLFAVLFLLPVYMQTIQGFGALAAGLTLLPQGLVMGGGTVLGEMVSKKGYVRASCLVGTTLLTAMTAAMLTLDAGTPAWVTALVLSVRGLAIGLVVQPLLMALTAAVPKAKLPDANTLFNVVERLAGSFGIATLATFLVSRDRFHVTEALRAHTPPQAAQVAGFHDTVLVLTLLSAAGFVLALLLRGRGWWSSLDEDRQAAPEAPPAQPVRSLDFS